MPEYLSFMFVTARDESEALRNANMLCETLTGKELPLDQIDLFNTRLWMQSMIVDEFVTPLRLPMDEGGVNQVKLDHLQRDKGAEALERFRDDFAMKASSPEAFARLSDALNRETCVVIDARDDTDVSFINTVDEVEQVLSFAHNNVWVVKKGIRYKDNT